MGIRIEDLQAGRVDLTDVVDPDGAPTGPIHPGEILRTEWLEPLGLTAYRLAKDIGVPPNRVTEILAGRRGISAETALRLARYFATDAQSWMNLQSHYDLELAQRQLGDRVADEVQPRAA
jgi:addiction module HigA family antidote